jgi:hypothetical protein
LPVTTRGDGEAHLDSVCRLKLAHHPDGGRKRRLRIALSVIEYFVLESGLSAIGQLKPQAEYDFSEGRLESGPSQNHPSQPTRRRDALSAFGKPTKVPAWPGWAQSCRQSSAGR